MKFVHFGDCVINLSMVSVMRKMEKDNDFSICCFFTVADGMVENFASRELRDQRFEELRDIFMGGVI